MTGLKRLGAMAYLGAAAVGVAAILSFYAHRLSTPLPLFAADEVAYLLHAIYPDAVVAQNPYVATASNGVHLSVIRAIVEAGGSPILGDRIVNLVLYLAGLVALWWAGVKRTPVSVPGELGLALLLLALGFPYYRFAISDLAEGLFVGVLAAFVLGVRRWWRSRPLVSAVLAGVLGAVMVLVKANGVAELAALGVVAVADAYANRDWARLPLRILLAALAFFAAGNLIQWLAEEPTQHPWAFFVSPTYGTTLRTAIPQSALGLGGLAVLAMTSASAVLAGTPCVVALVDIWRRWRAAGERFAAEGGDLAFLLLFVSLFGTIAMVAVFAMKIAADPGETYRLWGRYFEFFAPMLWLAAGPSLARGIGGRTAAAAAAVVTFAGLAGLLASFKAGIVLFPWDASILSAFFQPDPVRAPLHFALPLRALSILAVLLAGCAYAARLKPAFVGLALVLALGGLSTWLDGAWLGPMAAQRKALSHDFRAIRPRLPPGPFAFLSTDVNETHLAFLVLDARPHVIFGPPAQASAAELKGMTTAVVAGPQAPPDGPWIRTFKGEELSVYRRARP